MQIQFGSTKNLLLEEIPSLNDHKKLLPEVDRLEGFTDLGELRETVLKVIQDKYLDLFPPDSPTTLEK